MTDIGTHVVCELKLIAYAGCFIVCDESVPSQAVVTLLGIGAIVAWYDDLV